MAEFKRFSSGGCADVIENRDGLFYPYAEKRTSYLRKKDIIGTLCDFEYNPTNEDIENFIEEQKNECNSRNN